MLQLFGKTSVLLLIYCISLTLCLHLEISFPMCDGKGLLKWNSVCCAGQHVFCPAGLQRCASASSEFASHYISSDKILPPAIDKLGD
jgi:hypothetical protein